MKKLGASIEDNYLSFVDHLFSICGRDFCGAFTITAAGLGLYNFLSKMSPQIGSQLASPVSTHRTRKFNFQSGEEEIMRNELDRLKKTIKLLWMQEKKSEAKSILKQGSGKGKSVQFSNIITQIDLVRLKDAPLLERIDLSAEPKANNKIPQKRSVDS